MTDEASREPARDPQDLERLLISRQWVGDIDGMAAFLSRMPSSTAVTGD
ncbi:hypothetical protein [Mesorhizobium sp.]|nr:hypothetical protein [Mesorhizobium sp.]